MTAEDSGFPAATAEVSFTNFTEFHAEHSAANAAEKIAEVPLKRQSKRPA